MKEKQRKKDDEDGGRSFKEEEDKHDDSYSDHEELNVDEDCEDNNNKKESGSGSPDTPHVTDNSPRPPTGEFNKKSYSKVQILYCVNSSLIRVQILCNQLFPNSVPPCVTKLMLPKTKG